MHYALILVLLAAVFPCKNNAVAQQTVLDNDFTLGLIKAPVLALGGAYRALANDNNALLLNPAGIAQLRTTSVSLDYVQSELNDIQTMGGAAIDGQDMISYGIAFDYITQEVLNVSADIQHYAFGFAIPLSDNYYFGANVKYIRSDLSNPLISGPGGANGDLGFLANFTKYLSVGVVMQNIYRGTPEPAVPMILAGGVAVKPDANSALTFDVVHDFSTPASEPTNFHFGGLYAFTQDFAFRTGFAWDRLRDNPYIGSGLFVTAPKANLGFTYAHHFDPTLETFAVVLELHL